LRHTLASLMVFALFATRAWAQGAPAATSPDTPTIRLGVTLFTNYTLQTEPEVTDANGNRVDKSSFDVTRSYLNVTGNISRIIAFRVTPDIARETSETSSLNGSLEFRIKYAYLQTNVGEWLGGNSYARFGIQQTPYLDFMENIYRYRFQGTMFVERQGYFASADAGASFHYDFPSNYGDVHGGVFNGENYQRPEVNDQKDYMVRATLRPFPAGTTLIRGLRGTVFFDNGHYVEDADRSRLIGAVTYESQYLTAGYEYINAHDQTSLKTANVHSRGYSIWATPKQSANSVGWEGLIRYDHSTPDTSRESQKQNRLITGIAYWFPHQGNVTSALMLDYDGQLFKNVSTPENRSVIVHALVNF
jgi:hypothetical protein